MKRLISRILTSGTSVAVFLHARPALPAVFPTGPKREPPPTTGEIIVVILSLLAFGAVLSAPVVLFFLAARARKRGRKRAALVCSVAALVLVVLYATHAVYFVRVELPKIIQKITEQICGTTQLAIRQERMT